MKKRAARTAITFLTLAAISAWLSAEQLRPASGDARAIVCGLGVMLLGGGETLHFLHPGGNDPGVNCWVIMSPVTGRGAVIMTSAAAGEALMLEIMASIARHGAWPDLTRR